MKIITQNQGFLNILINCWIKNELKTPQFQNCRNCQSEFSWTSRKLFKILYFYGSSKTRNGITVNTAATLDFEEPVLQNWSIYSDFDNFHLKILVYRSVSSKYFCFLACKTWILKNKPNFAAETKNFLGFHGKIDDFSRLFKRVVLV